MLTDVPAMPLPLLKRAGAGGRGPLKSTKPKQAPIDIKEFLWNLHTLLLTHAVLPLEQLREALNTQRSFRNPYGIYP